MGTFWLDPDVVAVFALAVSGAVLGLIGVLEQPQLNKRASAQRKKAVLGLWLATLSVIGAGIGVACGMSLRPALAIAAPPALFLLLGGIRTYHARIVQFLATMMRARLLHAMLLLAGGPVLACLWAFHTDRATLPEFDLSAEDPTLAEMNRSARAVEERAFTDRGRSISLYSVMIDPQAAEFTRREEVLSQQMALRVLRVTSPDPGSNCHGWVFTGGRFWIKPQDVDDILEDNEYTETSQPQPGDLIIYRDNGAVAHSGVVKIVDNQVILIESKWGPLGRFMHAAADQGYAIGWNFYHSPRQGHVLRIESKNE